MGYDFEDFNDFMMSYSMQLTGSIKQDLQDWSLEDLNDKIEQFYHHKQQ